MRSTISASPRGPLRIALEDALRQREGTVAIAVDSQSATAPAFLRSIAARAAELIAAGLAPRRVCAIVAGRGLDYWRDFAAVIWAGAVVAPIDPALSDADRMTLRRLSNWSMIVGADGDSVQRLEGAASATEGVAAHLYTSGTTGLQKAVILTQAALLKNATATVARLGMSSADRLGVALTGSFTSAISHFLCSILARATFVHTEQRLLPAGLIAFLRDTRVTSFGGAPVQARHLITGDTPQLRWIMTSGDRLPPDTSAALLAAYPDLRIFAAYGLTEVGGRCCILAPDLIRTHPRSVGIPIAGLKVSIRDEEGICLPAGAEGVVYAAGESVFRGYSTSSDMEMQQLRQFGFRTGDVGYLDHDGLLYLIGRTDDVFKRGGRKVSTIAVADAIRATGLVEDVAVVTVDDTQAGTVAHAYCVPASPSTFTTAKLLRELRSRLASFEMPYAVYAVASLPRTESGKLQKRLMKEGGTARDAS